LKWSPSTGAITSSMRLRFASPGFLIAYLTTTLTTWSVYLVFRPVPTRGTAVYPDESWARSAFRVERVVANAHDGSIPPNQYVARAGERLVPPLAVLVERGSHAMAPDINRDGRFTPADDSTVTTKLLWGIRDHGTTWGRYRASYMDLRGAALWTSHPMPDREPCQLSRYRRPARCRTGSARSHSPPPIDATSLAIRLG
jgi:hypothetical protein